MDYHVHYVLILILELPLIFKVSNFSHAYDTQQSTWDSENLSNQGSPIYRIQSQPSMQLVNNSKTGFWNEILRTSRRFWFIPRGIKIIRNKLGLNEEPTYDEEFDYEQDYGARSRLS